MGNIELASQTHESQRGRHIGVYLPQPILDEMIAEAKRQSRTLSYLARAAWKIAAPRIRTFPDAPRMPSVSHNS